MRPPESLASPVVVSEGAGPIVRDLLGGPRFFRANLHSRAEVHEFLLNEGLQFGSLNHFVSVFDVIAEDEIAEVVGLSGRTLRRRRASPNVRVPIDVAGKTWLVATLFADAVELFGGRAEAERWLAEPAKGLDGQRPIDLMRTLPGVEIVRDFLGRLKFGVYT